MWVCRCLCVCVCILTPGRPPLFSLHGQCTHHSPHVCCRRRGNKRVCMLKSVSLRHVFQRLEHTHTLTRPLSSSHPPLSPSPLPLSQWLLLPETLFLSSILSCFLTLSRGAPPLPLSCSPHSPHTLLLFMSHPQFPVFLLGVVASHPPSLSLQLPPTFAASQTPERSISDSV